MCIARYRKTRYWTVIDAQGTLVCLCVYRKGAAEVVQHLQHTLEAIPQWQETNGPTMDVLGLPEGCQERDHIPPHRSASSSRSAQ